MEIGNNLRYYTSPDCTCNAEIMCKKRNKNEGGTTRRGKWETWNKRTMHDKKQLLWKQLELINNNKNDMTVVSGIVIGINLKDLEFDLFPYR